MIKKYRLRYFIAALFLSLPVAVTADSVDPLLKDIYRTKNKVLTLAEFPEPQVWINMMPVIDPKATPAVDVFITIFNNTNRDITYSFSSSQQFEIVLTDAFGNVVSRWSRGKFFLPAFTSLTIPPSGSQRLGGSIELTSDDGQALPPGGYTLAIKLTSFPQSGTGHTPGSQAPLSQMPLRIDWAY